MLPETMDPCCYWCSHISPREDPYKRPSGERNWLQDLFHSDCECRRRENALPSSACGFCEHLNIRHLVCCALKRDHLDLPTLYTEWYHRENPRNGCQFCEYMASYGTSEPGVGLSISYDQFWHPKVQWSNGDLKCYLNLRWTNQNHFIPLSQESVSQLQKDVN